MWVHVPAGVRKVTGGYGGAYQCLGGAREGRADPRVIGATNRDLDALEDDLRALQK